MNETHPQQLNNNDHDLLIRLDQKVGNIVDEMRLMRDDNARRLNAVEENKVNKSDFNDAKVESQKQFVQMDTRIAASMLERKLVRDKEIGDLQENLAKTSKKVDGLSTYIWIGYGIAVAVSFFLQLVVAPLVSNFLRK